MAFPSPDPLTRDEALAQFRFILTGVTNANLREMLHAAALAYGHACALEGIHDASNRVQAALAHNKESSP